MFSEFFPTIEGLKKKKELALEFINILFALVVLSEIFLMLYILSILNKPVKCPSVFFCLF